MQEELMYFRELPHALWKVWKTERGNRFFWTIVRIELQAPFRFYWMNRWRWRLLKLVPWQIKYWSVVELATKGEKGHPGYVTALTMMERASEGREGY
jgi:hypothetical protein